MVNDLTAEAALKYLNQGQLSAVELAQACLDRITKREGTVGAWEYLNPEEVLQQAKQADVSRAGGQLGILQGIPVAIKDIFATADMPTGWGTPIHAGKQLGYDAAVVERLRSAGAVLMGKTVTTEYAMTRAGKTRNPHNPNHTPGASSSGSAAAVADKMVPLAIGSQTMGSILRPAAYCGIYGFKPSFGMISRYGALPCSRELDHVGIFARHVNDLALLLSVLVGVDERDPDCYGARSLTPPETLSWNLDRSPAIALIEGPYWSQVEAEAQTALLNSADALRTGGATVESVSLPFMFDDYFQHATVLSSVGVAANHGNDYDRHADQMSPELRKLILRGRSTSSLAYAIARHTVVDYAIHLSDILTQYDAILTPVTTGIAPQGLSFTGSPIFCALWSLCGLPAINIPFGQAQGLPLGIQLVGRRTGDWALLKLAAWVSASIAPNV